MRKEGVSFIIASYNCVSYIDTCLKSVFQQNYNGDIEIIVCDDCSTDGTFDLLKHYAEMKQIVLLQNESNLGAATSRNNCLKIAKYDYIAILDADDYISPNRISIQMKVLKEHPEIAFVASGMRRFYENGDTQDYAPNKAIPESKDFLWSLPFAHATTIFRKNCLLDVNGYRISKETKRGHDYDLFMRLYAKGYKGMNIPDILYFYRCFTTKSNRDLYKYRIHESIVRFKGFRAMKLGFISIPYIIKPLVVGLMPKSVMIKKSKQNNKTR